MSQAQRHFALYTVGAATPVDACVRARLVPAGIRQGKLIERTFCHGNAVDMIRDSLQTGRPLAVAQDTGEAEPLCLPSTVAIDLKVMRREGDDILIFAGPRPSPLRIQHADTQLLHLVQEAQGTGKGVVFAVSGSFWVTDAALIPMDDAMRLLGFSTHDRDVGG